MDTRDAARVDVLTNCIWNYHLLHQELQPADCIIVLGSHDTRVAEYAAKLFLDGWAPLIVTSGGFGRLTKDIWSVSEAETFAAVIRGLGVPSDNILIENDSTNTGENISFSRALLQSKGLMPMRVIAVQKPYMERRAYATFQKIWPEVEVIVTSPPIAFADYPTKFRSKEEIINIVVGDLQRIKVYAKRGYAIPQEIPATVWEAYETLVAMGYTSHLIADAT